jgi:thioredoxin-related protein
MKIKSLLFTLVIALITSHSIAQSQVPSAEEVLKGACKEAKKQNKKVFILFHAAWCGWCHKMDDTMNDPSMKAYFENNFIIKHLTVYETVPALIKAQNPGSEEMIAKYNSDKFGIPLWFIFDSNGKLLADSHIRPAGTSFETKGTNIGCPASKEEVETFIKILKLTTKLSDVDLDKIFARFRQNDSNYNKASGK